VDFEIVTELSRTPPGQTELTLHSVIELGAIPRAVLIQLEELRHITGGLRVWEHGGMACDLELEMTSKGRPSIQQGPVEIEQYRQDRPHS